MEESFRTNASAAGSDSDSALGRGALQRSMSNVSTGSKEKPPCGSSLVMTEVNPFRKCWDCIVTSLLCYIGTIFPYRLCFIEFGMPEPMSPTGFWKALDFGIDILFWFDLFLNFFFSYQNEHKEEVVVPKEIVRNYMQCFFWLNLVACLPPSTFALVTEWLAPDAASTPSINQGTRMTRMHRLTRLAKLGRLTRLGRMFKFLSSNPFLRRLRSNGAMRIISLVGGLLWIVHLVGCGWFLCASIHENHLDTWVARRTVNSDDLSLLDAGPFIQWCHAGYFTLTVFTTVGFGDMSAATTGEIVYVSFTMILGAVINSIIVGEVINIVTAADREHIKIREHKAQVESFCEHTDLDNRTKLAMVTWIEQASSSFDYDDAIMLKMLTSGCLPRVLLEQLPYAMFGGQLVKNSFVTLCSMQVRHVPPRFTVLLALKVYQIAFTSGEFVYHYNDHPFNLFLVRAGIFAHVARVGDNGGYHEVPQVDHAHSKESSLMSKLRGLVKPGSIDPNQAQHEYNAVLGASLYPFRLLGRMCYFGDAELITGKPRQTTVRCESPDGLILGLHKGDFFGLMHEYPNFARAWRLTALRHDRQNKQMIQSLHQGHRAHNHRVLAGDVLIKFLREFRENRGNRVSTTARRAAAFDARSKRNCSASETKKSKYGSNLEGAREKRSNRAGVADVAMEALNVSKGLSRFGELPTTNGQTSTFMRNFNAEPTALTEVAAVQNKMQSRMASMEGQMTSLQGSVDGIHSLLQKICVNLKPSELHEL
jgi:CRP-like cAMP-binding protein